MRFANSYGTTGRAKAGPYGNFWERNKRQMEKRVLALQHVWDDHTGHIGEILQEYHITCDTINVEAEAVPDPTPYDAIIVFGGSQQAYDDERYPYFVQEKLMLRKAIEQNMPFLGLCLGGQLLAAVLGAPVKRHTITEIGFFDVPLTEAGQADPLFAGLPSAPKVFHWHEDIFDLPQGATLLASTETTPNQAFRFGEHIYGLQYHIELNAEMLDTWLHHSSLQPDIINILGQAGYEQLERETEHAFPLYFAHSRLLFENFLRIAKLI